MQSEAFREEVQEKKKAGFEERVGWRGTERLFLSEGIVVMTKEESGNSHNAKPLSRTFLVSSVVVVLYN